MRLPFGADRIVVLKIGLNIENLQRATGERKKTSGSGVNSVERHFCQAGRCYAPVLEEFLDLRVGQHDVDGPGSLSLDLKFCGNTGADIDHLGFLAENSFDEAP